MEKILVTGGAGYIGSVMVPELIKMGYKVTVIDNFTFNQSSLIDIIHHKNLNIIKGDIRDIDLLNNNIQKMTLSFL